MFASTLAGPTYQERPIRSSNRIRQQYSQRPLGPEVVVSSADRAEAVKDAFKFAWNGYYTYAFPNDELLSVTNTSDNPR